MTQTSAGRGLEPDPALGDSARLSGLAQLGGDGETAWFDLFQRLAEQVANARMALDRDYVPAERDQVAPVAIGNELTRCRVDIPGGQGLLEVCEPGRYGRSGCGCVDQSIGGGFGHRGALQVVGGLEIRCCARIRLHLTVLPVVFMRACRFTSCAKAAFRVFFRG